MPPAFYINLDPQTARRASLEDSFRRHAPPGARLTRVAALTPDQVRQAGVAGAIRDAEKACFLSHVKAIQLAAAHPGPALVLEDDVLIGPRTLAITEALLAHAAEQLDILFLDVCIAGMHDMMNLFFFKKTLVQAGRVEFLDISRMEFAGASAYVVTPRGKDRLARLLAETRALDRPYDLWLRDHVAAGRLRAFAAFPFLATLSPHSAASAIQPEESRLNNLIWDAFRRLMFIEFEQGTDNPLEDIDRLPAALFDRPADAFSKVLRLALTDAFYRTQPPMTLPIGGGD